MRPENKNMVEFLKANGIKADVKYIWDGSLKQTWRLTMRKAPGFKVSFEEKWGQFTLDIRKKLAELGFRDDDGKPIDSDPFYGSTTCLFVRGHYELKEGVARP